MSNNNKKSNEILDKLVAEDIQSLIYTVLGGDAYNKLLSAVYNNTMSNDLNDKCTNCDTSHNSNNDNFHFERADIMLNKLTAACVVPIINDMFGNDARNTISSSPSMMNYLSKLFNISSDTIMQLFDEYDEFNITNNEVTSKFHYATVVCIDTVHGAIWKKHYETDDDLRISIGKAIGEISIEMSEILRKPVNPKDIKKYLPNIKILVTDNFWNSERIPNHKLIEVDQLEEILKNKDKSISEISPSLNDNDEFNLLLKSIYNASSGEGYHLSLNRKYLKEMKMASTLNIEDESGRKMRRLPFNPEVSDRILWLNKPESLRHIKTAECEFWFDENGNENHAIFPDGSEEWGIISKDGKSRFITHKKCVNGDEFWYDKEGNVIREKIEDYISEYYKDMTTPGLLRYRSMINNCNIKRETWYKKDGRPTLRRSTDLTNKRTVITFTNGEKRMQFRDAEYFMNHDPEHNRTFLESKDGNKYLYDSEGKLIYVKRPDSSIEKYENGIRIYTKYKGGSEQWFDEKRRVIRSKFSNGEEYRLKYDHPMLPTGYISYRRDASRGISKWYSSVPIMGFSIPRHIGYDNVIDIFFEENGVMTDFNIYDDSKCTWISHDAYHVCKLDNNVVIILDKSHRLKYYLFSDKFGTSYNYTENGILLFVQMIPRDEVMQSFKLSACQEEQSISKSDDIPEEDVGYKEKPIIFRIVGTGINEKGEKFTMHPWYCQANSYEEAVEKFQKKWDEEYLGHKSLYAVDIRMDSK